VLNKEEIHVLIYEELHIKFYITELHIMFFYHYNTLRTSQRALTVVFYHSISVWIALLNFFLCLHYNVKVPEILLHPLFLHYLTFCLIMDGILMVLLILYLLCRRRLVN